MLGIAPLVLGSTSWQKLVRLMSTDLLLIHYSTRSQLCVCVVQGCSISDCEAVIVRYQVSCLKLLHFQAYVAAQRCTFSNCFMGIFLGNNNMLKAYCSGGGWQSLWSLQVGIVVLGA